jgi:hypothetical protein
MYQRQAKEPEGDYVKRLKKLLPNFPEDVLGQWFYDHSQQIKNWQWLDFHTVNVAAMTWQTAEVPLRNIGRDKEKWVSNYAEHYAHHQPPHPRFQRIVEHFSVCGTWPRPVIYLANPSGVLISPSGVPCGRPYHLVEGHHRIAVFAYFKHRGQLREAHQVWLVTLRSH